MVTPGQTANQRRQRRHVYLFRHCVRSTSADVNNVDPDRPGIKAPLSDYIGNGHTLPAWTATEGMDCTKRGLKIMEGEGQHIARSLLEEMQNDAIYPQPKKRIRLRFISDITKRDSDTTLALVRGFNGVFPRGNIDISVQYDQDLYRPLSDRRLSFGLNKLMADNFVPLCEKKYTDEMLKSELEDRLENLPRPEGSLAKVLQVMQKVTGSDAWYPSETFADKTTISDDGEVEGVINPLRVITQAIFYSRASNMEPTFLPEVTTELLYRLLEWTYWYVSLTEQENSHSMTTVAPLAASILQVLKIGEHEDMKYDDDVLTAYVYVGHDTDIARLGSAFGLRHNLAAPYYTSARTRDLYSPAPPGSAMHLVHDVRHRTVETEFLYPTLIISDGRLVWDGRLDTVPMKKRTIEDNNHRKRRSLSNFGGPGRSESGMDILERRMKKNLERFDGAMECYERAKFLSSWPRDNVMAATTNLVNNDGGGGSWIHQELFGLRIGGGDGGGISHLQLLYIFAVTAGVIFLSIATRRIIWPTPAEKANISKRKAAARQRMLSEDSFLGEPDEFGQLNTSHTE